MTDYIISIPDEYFPRTAHRDVYFPDERHSPMQLREVVLCRDCRAMRVKYGNTGIECWMGGEPFTVELDDFCSYGERREE